MNPYKLALDIIDNFDFVKVQEVMNFLDWKWAPINRVPTIDEIKRTAHHLLIDAIELSENEPFIHEEVIYLSATGGLKATVAKNKKNKVDMINLEFIISEWREENN